MNVHIHSPPPKHCPATLQSHSFTDHHYQALPGLFLVLSAISPRLRPNRSTYQHFGRMLTPPEALSTSLPLGYYPSFQFLLLRTSPILLGKLGLTGRSLLPVLVHPGALCPLSMLESMETLQVTGKTKKSLILEPGRASFQLRIKNSSTINIGHEGY